MVWYVTGSNIFGQWPWDDLLKNTFTQSTPKVDNSNDFKLMQISWSYNILQIDGEYYISGAWGGKENQLIKISRPSEFSESEELIVVGNDYHYIVASKNSSNIWVGNLSMNKEMKKVNLMIEQPMQPVKKRKRCNNIAKLVLMNDSCLYLTSEGNVYSGILPSYVCTSHCKGIICDIQCGYEHYVLLTDMGYVYSWGNGRRFQHGHGDICTIELPKEVEALAGIKITKISCGGWHTLALSEFGDVYTWGWNESCQLGLKGVNEQHESSPTPTLVDLYDDNGKELAINVKDIACGSKHSVLLLEDNTVWTTGYNNCGQLGFSEEKYPLVGWFRKAFSCDKNSKLMCGPWATALVNS